MADELVHLEIGDDGVAVVTLDRPKVNALNGELLAQLHEIASRLTDDPPGAVVVTGGRRVFAAGADISEFGGPEEAREIGAAFHRTLDAVAAIPRMVIAAVNGYALGGGCELSMACDLRFAATDAVFGQPEVLLGLIPGGGGTQRLPRLVGPARAKELVMSGRNLDAVEAHRIGLVDRLIDPDEVLDVARTEAAAYARGALQAQALSKKAIDAGIQLPLAEALGIELEAFEAVFHTEDSRIGVQSFLAQGPGRAEFTGR